MTSRRWPRPDELRTLLAPRSIPLNPLERRLGGAHTIGDLRAIAKRRTPRAVFDYVDGAAEDETSLRRARDAFSRVEFLPRVLRDVSSVDPSTDILGRRSALPLALAPTGFTRMMNHQGESAVARVAEGAGVPYALSTMGTTSLETLAAVVPQSERWFQLYLWKDRAASRELIGRAAAAGYGALILTVDTPVAGARQRDVRNGLTIPPALTVRTLLDGALHPSWWFNLLSTETLSFASLQSSDGTVAELINRLFDPTITFDDLAWLREEWQGPLIVKGVLDAEDARAIVDRGADAIIVSNHGARQLDRSPTPLEQLPLIAAAVGDRAEVYLDGGILSGADIVAGIALGADACLVGRAYLYGLMAGGQPGVQRALDILTQEITRTMQLLGVHDIVGLAGCARLRS
jgi:L-lactate dehydrogenase (cytochrome)